jgi:hypothetical protein
MMREKHSNEISLCWIACLICLGFILHEVSSGHKIVVYKVWKDTDGTLTPLNRTVTRVNPSRQTIIYWRPGEFEVPKKLVDCVVRNRNNWVGYHHETYEKVEMSKGVIIEENIDSGVRQVNGFRWWILKIFDW